LTGNFFAVATFTLHSRVWRHALVTVPRCLRDRTASSAIATKSRCLVAFFVYLIIFLSGGIVTSARADGVLPSTASLDGGYLLLGPSIAGHYGSHSQQWDSDVGLSIAAIALRERETVALRGIAISATRLTKLDVSKIRLAGLLGTRRGVDRLFGLEISGTIEIADVGPTAVGGHVGLWLFAGVTPFIRAGVAHTTLYNDLSVELGLAIELPIWRRR
jgi:hypothetical protein